MSAGQEEAKYPPPSSPQLGGDTSANLLNLATTACWPYLSPFHRSHTPFFTTSFDTLKGEYNKEDNRPPPIARILVP